MHIIILLSVESIYIMCYIMSRKSFMTDYEKLKYTDKNSIVYVIQDVPGSRDR